MTTPLTSATAANAFIPLASPTPAPRTAAIASLAVGLSNDSSMIASIGGTSTPGAGVYNAQGLMSNFLQAAAQTVAASTAVDTAADANDSNTGAVANAAASSSTGDTSITTSGTEPNTFNGTPDWASVLKDNPSLTGVFLADSTNQLLVNQLSVFA